jgi:hypothetical protein
MNYLEPSDYELYGLEPATPQALVAAASTLMDAHCRRPTLGVASYTERLRLSPGRNTVRLSFLPLAPVAPAPTPIVSARARYGVPRRGEGAGEFAADVAQTFNLPGAWTALDPALIDCNAETGELTLPNNALGLAFNEVELTYNAGLSAIPDSVKFACAQIVRNAQATPALNVRSGTLDRMRLEYFADSLVDSNVRALLAPYVAQKI